jgi:hypothetical protein
MRGTCQAGLEYESEAGYDPQAFVQFRRAEVLHLDLTRQDRGLAFTRSENQAATPT